MIVWIDTETTGLDPAKENLLEIAVVATDDNLNEIATYETLISGADLDDLDDFIVEMHTKSGLLDSLRAGKGKPLADVSAEIVAWLRVLAPSSDLKKIPLGGSSVQFDRNFLQVHMPDVIGLLSYRNVDVSSMTELYKRADAKGYAKRRKENRVVAHRAIDDIRYSISEAKFFAERKFAPVWRRWFR